MAAKKILIVEDEEDVVELIRYQVRNDKVEILGLTTLYRKHRVVNQVKIKALQEANQCQNGDTTLISLIS